LWFRTVLHTVFNETNLLSSPFTTEKFAQVLARHATRLGKSSKGGAAALAERIGSAWAKGPSFQAVSERPAPGSNKERRCSAQGNAGPPGKRRKNAGADQYFLRFKASSGSGQLVETFATATALAERAWQLCEDNDLEMPSEEWNVVSGIYEPSCYNAMFLEEDEDAEEPKEAFEGYVINSLLKAREALELSDGAGGSIEIFSTSTAPKGAARPEAPQLSSPT
jgi:hypothetical protein